MFGVLGSVESKKGGDALIVPNSESGGEVTSGLSGRPF
jgi:hypothetical protein